MSKQTIQGRFWVMKDGRNFLGEGKIELLRNINATGSISAAAKLMKMSYKAAWDDVDAMNNIADTPLVERTVGGKRGGGTSLTADGIALLNYFDRVHGYFNRFMEDMHSAENNPLSAKIVKVDNGFWYLELNQDTKNPCEIRALTHTNKDSALKAGERVKIKIAPSALTPLLPEAAAGFDNIIPGYVAEVKNGLIIHSSGLKCDTTDRLKVEKAMPLSLGCSARNVWLD